MPRLSDFHRELLKPEWARDLNVSTAWGVEIPVLIVTEMLLGKLFLPSSDLGTIKFMPIMHIMHISMLDGTPRGEHDVSSPEKLDERNLASSGCQAECPQTVALETCHEETYFINNGLSDVLLGLWSHTSFEECQFGWNVSRLHCLPMLSHKDLIIWLPEKKQRKKRMMYVEFRLAFRSKWTLFTFFQKWTFSYLHTVLLFQALLHPSVEYKTR